MKQSVQKVCEIQVSYRPSMGRKPIIKCAVDAYNELIHFFPEETIALQERFIVIYLNRCNRILGLYPLSLGGITGTVVDVRLLLSVALKTAATSIILSHNHPSGNLKPSQADQQLTKKIVEACKLLDITVQDHLIISPEKEYFSFSDEGLL